MNIWDAFPGQIHEEVSTYTKKMGGIDCVEIPGKMTKHLQPLDLTVNKPFKQYYDEEYDEWFLNGRKDFTPSGYRQSPNYQEICDFIIRAWEKVSPETIRKGFLQAGISNAMDGSEDDLVKFI